MGRFRFRQGNDEHLGKFRIPDAGQQGLDRLWQLIYRFSHLAMIGLRGIKQQQGMPCGCGVENHEPLNVLGHCYTNA